MTHVIMGWERALPWLIAALLTGYLAGSIPFGLLISRALGLGDPRNIGSGNIGATNMLRTGSRLAAALTLVLDFAKGLVPVVVFLAFWGDLAAQAAGIGAVLGHCLPVWLWFRGGKGMATFLGVLYGLYWPAGIAISATWLVAALLSRMSSVGALAAAFTAPLWFYAFQRPEAVLAVAVLSIWVWLRHRRNIGRIVRGEEPRISLAGKRR